MLIRKVGGKVCGAKLTAAEKKAMDIEIQKETAEYVRKTAFEIDAIVLWILHEKLGLGPKRLKRFYDDFGPAISALIDRYDLEDSDQVWLCTQKLKDYGVDIETWHNER